VCHGASVVDIYPVCTPSVGYVNRKFARREGAYVQRHNRLNWDCEWRVTGAAGPVAQAQRAFEALQPKDPSSWSSTLGATGQQGGQLGQEPVRTGQSPRNLRSNTRARCARASSARSISTKDEAPPERAPAWRCVSG
jgi:hypothetical protein